MADIPTSSTHNSECNSEIDFNVELGLFPVMVPSLFLPKVGERLPYQSGRLPGRLEVITNARGKEGRARGKERLARGDDGEERVYRVLENYDRDKYMVVFHSIDINAEKIQNIWGENKCSRWYDFIRKIDKDLVMYHPGIVDDDVTLYLDVPLINDPNKTESGTGGFGFTVYTHQRFVAVILEVYSSAVTDVENCSAQLLDGADLVESVMDGNNRDLVRILCCPKLKQDQLSLEMKESMNSKNIILVYGEDFDDYLVEHLNSLQKNVPWCESKPLDIQYKGIFNRPTGKEKVNVVLDNDDRNQYRYFYVTKTTERLRQEQESQINIYLKIDEKFLKNEYVGDVTYVDVHSRSEPMLSVPRGKEFDFIVIHERFVAVVEVKGLKNIADGCIQLQQSAALVKSMEDADINMILCCPNLKKMVISSKTRKKMTSENLYIVCDDGLGFEANLERLLNSLKKDTESRPVNLLKKEELSRRLASIYHEGVNSKKTLKNDDIWEMVHRELESYEQDQKKHMRVFQGIEIKEEYEILPKNEKCPIPFNFIPQDTDEHTKSLMVELKESLIRTIPGNNKNDFIVIHERFVAVVEVNGLKGIEYGYIRLQASAAFVKSMMGSDVNLVVNKILCCPLFQKTEISLEAQNKMESDSENMFIVCGDENNFKTNLTDLLNRLQDKSTTRRGDLKKLTEQVECVYFPGVVKDNMLKRDKLNSGKLVRTMDFFIRTQNVRPNKQVLVTSFKLFTEDIDRFNPDHARNLIYLTPQQEEAFKRKNMIMIGAAGTGKTALIKAKVIELVESKKDEQIVIVPSANCNRANFENHKNVQILAPQYLEDKCKLVEIVEDLHEILYQWKQLTKSYNVKLDNRDEIADQEQKRRVFEDESGARTILNEWEQLVKGYRWRRRLAITEEDFIGVKGIVDIWEQLMDAYKKEYNHEDIKNKWEQLMENYKVRSHIRDIIDEGEKLLEKFEKRSDLRDSSDELELMKEHNKEMHHVTDFTDTLEQLIEVYKEGIDITDAWKKLIKNCTVKDNEMNIIDKGKQLVELYEKGSGVKVGLDELEQLIKEYKADTAEKNFIDKWKQLIKKYEVRSDVRDIIDMWEQLINPYAKEKNEVKKMIEIGEQIACKYRAESDEQYFKDKAKRIKAEKRFTDDQRDERRNVMNHLSRIVGVYMGQLITEYFGNESDSKRQLMYAIYDGILRKNKECIKVALPVIKDPHIASVMERLEENWTSAKDYLKNVFNESHFFIDDAFSGDKDCHDIFSFFALKWLNKKATDEHNHYDQTKCFWIAGDLSQLMHDECKYSYENFFISYKDEIPGIHDAVVWLDAVMRCSKSVFETWEPVRKTILTLLGQEMFLDDNVTNDARSRKEKKTMLRAGYGFHHPGSATVLKPGGFKQVVDLVKDITNRIKFLTRDKSLTHSQFAVLCCDVPGHAMVLSAVQEQFQHDECFTQSIAEFHQDEEQEDKRDEIRNKIVLDSSENSVGLEWPVVFVICSDLYTKFDHKFTIQKYLACSRCRVRLFVYPELPSRIFKHGNGASCSVCRQVRRKKMLESVSKLDGDSIADQFESLYDQNEELEARVQDLEQKRMEMSQKLQNYENTTDSCVRKEDFEARGQDLE